MTRPSAALAVLSCRVDAVTRLHGPHRSPHETLGLLDEEVAELVDAIRSNDRQATIAELYDVATVAIRGVIALEERT